MPASDPIELVEDHREDALALLLTQFQDKPRLAAVLCAFVDPAQETEDAAWQLLTERDLDTAVGAQLDMLGRLVGEAREGRADSEYRPFVRARVLINRSNGLPEEILRIVRVVTGSTVELHLREHFPAAFTVEVVGPIPFTPATLLRLLRASKAAGVRVLLEYSLLPEEETFAFASRSTVELDASRGFGSTLDPAVGGGLAGVTG